MTLDHFKTALLSFPHGLGLGWDGLHPRILLRLGDITLMAILRLLLLCEAVGKWPKAADDVIISLLPKSSEGVRCIGLFAWLPKIWSKIRRKVADQWEHDTQRAYLYAGAGRGADIAAWKQAARAEHAATVKYAQYGISLLDLVKAFDHIPWHLLVAEAQRLGYSLWVLRLSVATYSALRYIRMNGVHAAAIRPKRSLTAGSGLATTEMRLALISIVDRALNAAPQACPTLYVDDLSVEVVGGHQFVLRQMVAFVRSFCRSVRNAFMAVSDTKSYCSASTIPLGEAIQAALSDHGVRFKQRVTSLGAAIGSGRRRNATVMKGRLFDFRKRLPRFRRLAKNGVSTARLLRTGGTSAMSYGQAITGVAPTTLLAQRRTAAAIIAPRSGPSGQDLDMALALAGDSLRGRADPAFDAHLLPIGAWADAVWHTWLPHNVLQQITAAAQNKLADAANRWQRVAGPAAATVASAWRLGWQVHSHAAFTTDLGRSLDLTNDPPVVVRREVVRSVRRWRDAAVFKRHSHLGDIAKAHGLHMQPIWNVLTTAAGKDVEWTAKEKASLRSALAGRQWPQLRCWQAEFAEHDRCMLCVHEDFRANMDYVSLDNVSDPSRTCPTAMTHGAYTYNNIISAPVGSIQHRICECPSLQQHRERLGPSLMNRFQPGEIPTPVQDAFATGLFSLPRLQVPVKPPPLGSFQWIHKEDQCDFVQGRIYTDASRVDDDHPDTMRLGWAFVVLDRLNHVTAVARGVPPHFVDDIAGAEAWALLQAATVSLPGSTFYSDCKSCVDLVHAGPLVACGPKKPLARTFKLLFARLDDVPPEAVVWMPAHTAEHKVGESRLSNGDLLTHPDRNANQRADTEAKAAARVYALSREVILDVQHKARVVQETAKWLGHATWLATHGEPPAPRDSEASRATAMLAKASQFTSGPADSNAGKKRSDPLARARDKTVQERVARWTRRAATTRTERPHQLMMSGNIVWCNICGAYAAGHAVHIARGCPGPVDLSAAGGRAQQLRRLRAGKHPKLRHTLQPAVVLDQLAASRQRAAPNTRTRKRPLDSRPEVANGCTPTTPSGTASAQCAATSTTTTISSTQPSEAALALQQLHQRVKARERALLATTLSSPATPTDPPPTKRLMIPADGLPPHGNGNAHAAGGNHDLNQPRVRLTKKTRLQAPAGDNGTHPTAGQNDALLDPQLRVDVFADTTGASTTRQAPRVRTNPLRRSKSRGKTRPTALFSANDGDGNGDATVIDSSSTLHACGTDTQQTPCDALPDFQLTQELARIIGDHKDGDDIGDAATDATSHVQPVDHGPTGGDHGSRHRRLRLRGKTRPDGSTLPPASVGPANNDCPQKRDNPSGRPPESSKRQKSATHNK